MDLVQEKMWDLHDKLSDAILSASRLHFRNVTLPNNNTNGYVFVKQVFPLYDLNEIKSLDSIRAALETLDDHLHFLQTIQVQQRAESDAAIARIEQSRIFLARRLSEHQGKKYEVIEEALAFVGETGQFISSIYTETPCPHCKKLVNHRGSSFNPIKVVINGLGYVQKSLRIKEMGGLLGNAALVALSMLALLHLHQMGSDDNYMLGLPFKQGSGFYNRNARRSFRSEDSSLTNHMANLDVTLARG